MAIEVGMIVEGKVTGISKFGAFVQLEEGKSGMVHISEVSNGFVTEIKDFLAEGQTVKVKVIGIDDKGRINLSVKQAEPKPQPSHRDNAPQERQFNAYVERPKPALSFEEMMSKFKQDSEARCADLKTAKDTRKGGKRSSK